MRNQNFVCISAALMMLMLACGTSEKNPPSAEGAAAGTGGSAAGAGGSPASGLTGGTGGAAQGGADAGTPLEQGIRYMCALNAELCGLSSSTCEEDGRYLTSLACTQYQEAVFACFDGRPASDFYCNEYGAYPNLDVCQTERAARDACLSGNTGTGGTGGTTADSGYVVEPADPTVVSACAVLTEACPRYSTSSCYSLYNDFFELYDGKCVEPGKEYLTCVASKPPSSVECEEAGGNDQRGLMPESECTGAGLQLCMAQ